MLQPGRDPALTHRAQPAFLGLRGTQAGLLEELFDRDRAVQPLVMRLPDNAHGAAADALSQSVATRHQAVFVGGQRLTPVRLDVCDHGLYICVVWLCPKVAFNGSL